MISIENFNEKYIKEAALGLINTYGQDPWNENWTFDSAKRRIEMFIANPNAFSYIIEYKQSIVGYIFGHKDIMSDGDIAFIDELFILPSFQKKGYAKNALELLCQILKTKNINKIELYTIVEDLRFYKKCGFIKNDYIHCEKKL